MTSVTALFIAACTLALPHGPKTERWAMSASGDDGRVRVTVEVYRDIVAPGEISYLRATSEVLVDGPLRFPQRHHQPLAFLYLETPDGKVFFYSQGGVSPTSYRALEKKDYDRFFLVKKGPAGQVIRCDASMTSPSPDWWDAKTLDRAKPNLRNEGVYEAWGKYSIPKVKGVPDDVWTGSVETKRVRFRVKAMPVADRRAEATEEQIEHLNAYVEYIDAFISGKKYEKERPPTIEMPQWLSLDQRIEWALQRTENEGFARYIVKQLRKHQPMNRDDEYPRWWSNVSRFVANRAYNNRSYGERPLAIVGPYLEEFSAIAIDELERELKGRKGGALHSSPHHWHSIVLGYVTHKPDSPLRKQLEMLARQYAKIPDDPPLRDRILRNQLAVSWNTMYSLGMFRDGMPLAELKELLGEPVLRKDDTVLWNYGTGSRRMEPGVSGKIIHDGKRETIVFSSRDHWRY